MKKVNDENKKNMNTINNNKAHRTFGEQIKSRLKISKIGVNIKTNTRVNTDRVSQDISHPLTQRNSSQKSVRFAEHILSVSTTKHSTSSILKNKSHKNISNSINTFRLSSKQSLNTSKSKNSLLSNQYNSQEDQSCENMATNQIQKQKYQKIIASMKNGHRKFTDELYPPIKVSLENGNTNHYPNVKWMRINQVFACRQLIVWSNDPQKKSTIVINRSQMADACGLEYMVTVLNSLKYCNSMLERIFESQLVNNYGVYYLKINQNNVWKYIIIDDYIPVVKQNGHYVPMFIKTTNHFSPQIQIWPFLLLKAYAKYYSSYNNLLYGNQIDFIEELTLNTCSVIPIDTEQQVGELIKKSSAFNFMLLGRDLKNNIHSIQVAKGYSQNQDSIIYEDKQCNYKKYNLSIRQFYATFTQVYQINTHQFTTSVHSLIRSNHQQQPFILRSFIIHEQTSSLISLIQKDSKKYSQQIKYSYSWLRLILVVKQNSSYRWIDGVYSKNKNINLRCTLEPGQYFIIVMSEWSHNKIYDLSLVVKTSSDILLQKMKPQDYQNILVQSCMDIAQRQGKLYQISNSLCSYHFIHYKIGFIIENINNQERNRSVMVQRSIHQIKEKFPIQPVNKEFKQKNLVMIRIEPYSHYTVILKLVKGLNLSLLNFFSFGQ